MGAEDAVRAEAGDSSPETPERESPTLSSVDGDHPEVGALDLDRLVHERVRLGIVSALAVNGSLGFTDLRDLLGVTDGNLSAHARRLEEADYILCHKSFEGRTPRTEYELAPAGRAALTTYLAHMEALIQATRDA